MGTRKIAEIEYVMAGDIAGEMPHADIRIGEHGAAVIVYGADIDELVTRAVVIRDAIIAARLK